LILKIFNSLRAAARAAARARTGDARNASL